MNEIELPWHTASLQAELADVPRRPHAVLYVGPAGIGKAAYAQALAAALMCAAPAADGRACGRCAPCGWVAADTHPDVRRLTRLEDEDGRLARDIKIEQVRALQALCALHAQHGGRRVVIIDPAESLNTAAANALLKTLEEPGEGVFFLLLASRPDALPATVRSRCQTRVLPSPAADEVIAWLMAQAGCSRDEAQTALSQAHGAPRHARTFIEPGQASAYRTMFQAITLLPDSPLSALVDVLHSVPAREWLPLLQRWWVDVGRVQQGMAPHYFPEHAPRLRQVAARADAVALAQVGQALVAQMRVVDHPLNARLYCEQTLAACYDALGAQRP